MPATSPPAQIEDINEMLRVRTQSGVVDNIPQGELVCVKLSKSFQELLCLTP